MKIHWKTYIILLLTLGLGGILGLMSMHFCHKSGVGGIYNCRWTGAHKAACNVEGHGENCKCGGGHGKWGHGKWKGHKKGFGHHGMKKIEPEYILKKMKKRLDLTEDQIAKIKPQLAGFSDRINANLKDHRSAMLQIMIDMETALAPILNEEQMKKFKEKMEKKKKYFSEPEESPEGK